MKKLLVLFLTIGFLFGCSNDQTNEQSEPIKSNETTEQVITVIVSTNNGEKIVEEKEIEITANEEQSVMEIMEENFEIETQFDGAFISTINGVAASEEEKTSWFYSVNGEEAMVGAKEYKVKENDEIQFDLHSWE